MTPWRRYIQCVAADPTGPILPWLAPRVFKSWPEQYGKRAASNTVRRICKEEAFAKTTRPTTCSAQHGQRKPTSRSFARRYSDHALASRHESPSSDVVHAGLPRGSQGRPNASLWYQAISGNGNKGGPETKDTAPGSPFTGCRSQDAQDRILDQVLGAYIRAIKDPSSEDMRMYTSLARDILGRYDSWLNHMTNRRTSEASRLRRRRRETETGLDSHKRGTRFVSIGILKGSGDGDTLPESALETFSSKWNESIAALHARSSAVKGAAGHTTPLRLSKDAGIWRSLIEHPEDQDFEWRNLPLAISQSLNDRRRSELRRRVGLRERQLAKSGLRLQGDIFTTALEQAIWRDAQERLWSQGNVPEDHAFVSQIWQEALLHVLANSPIQAPRFLRRTNVEPLPSRYMVADALEYSIKWAAQHPDHPALLDTTWWSDIATAISILSKASERTHLDVPGFSLTTVLRHIPTDTVNACVKDWQRSQVVVTGNTLLHAADRLAREGEAQQAVSLLNDNFGIIVGSVKSDALQSVLTTVLRGVSLVEDSLHICQDLVTRAINHGVAPGVQLFNVIMLNAVEANDVNLALNIYNTLRSNDVTPDRYTFSMLAKACKSGAADEQKVAQIIDDALRSGLLLTEPVVAGEILHALYQHHFTNRPGDAYRLMVEAYEQLFDRSVLDKLGLVQFTGSHRPENPLQPDAPVIGMVVNAYLKAGKPTPAQALALYQQMVELAKQEVHPLPALFEADYVSNAFISFFGSNATTRPIAIAILQTSKSIVKRSQSSSAETHKAGASTDSDDWFTQPFHYEGLTHTTIGIVQDMFARHSHPSNNFLGTARRMLDHMLATNPDVDPRALMEMIYAYLRHGDSRGAEWCIERLEAMDAWDHMRGAGIQRMITEAREKMK